MNLTGKAAIVTGGGTGVGHATSLLLAEQGCSVLVNYSRSREKAEQTAADCEQQGVKALAVRADVSKDDDCKAMVASAEQAFGHLEVLVNNAGQTKFCAHDNLDGLDTSDWQRILGVNLIGPYLVTRAAQGLLAANEFVFID